MESKIIKEIRKVKKEINPRPEWVALSRDILLQQINPQKTYQPAKIGLPGYFNFLFQLIRQHAFQPAVVMLLIFSTFIGSALTINAAFYSLPGEPLYGVKIALENTHAALLSGDRQKAELKIEFAQKRMAELDKVVAQVNVDPREKKKRIEMIAAEFKNNVTQVSSHLAKISSDNKFDDSDKEQTVKMALTVSTQANDLAESLGKKVAGMTDSDKAEVKLIVAQAVESAQETSAAAKKIAQQAAGDESGSIKGAENVTSTEALAPEIKAASDAAKAEATSTPEIK